MKALSLDLRQRIVAALDAGQTQASLAQRFCVSLASVERLARKKRDDQRLAPLRHLGKTPLVQEGEQDAFEALAASQNRLDTAKFGSGMAAAKRGAFIADHRFKDTAPDRVFV